MSNHDHFPNGKELFISTEDFERGTDPIALEGGLTLIPQNVKNALGPSVKVEDNKGRTVASGQVLYRHIEFGDPLTIVDRNHKLHTFAVTKDPVLHED